MFTKPQTPKRQGDTSAPDGSAAAGSGDSTTPCALQTYDGIVSNQKEAASPSKNPPIVSVSIQEKTDYERYFLKFEPPSHSTVAEDPDILTDCEEIERAQRVFDEIISQSAPRPISGTPSISRGLLGEGGRYRSRGQYQPPVAEIIGSLQGTAQDPIDLADDIGIVERCRPQDLLRAVTVRHLHFAEDVRPPYCGTYTKAYTQRQVTRLRRAPFKRVRADTDYDYDSEAEWEEPEEGEDILSDADEDAESVGSAGEMDGFLDDEDAVEGAKVKKNVFVNESPPISTGLCWENAYGTSSLVPNETTFDLKSMKLEWLLHDEVRAVDPYSSAYWSTEAASSTAPDAPTKEAKAMLNCQDGLMKPPRVPLQVRANSANTTVIVGAASGEKGPIMAVSSQKAAKSSATKLQGDDLLQFRDAVDGSNLTQAELLKALKQR